MYHIIKIRHSRKTPFMCSVSLAVALHRRDFKQKVLKWLKTDSVTYRGFDWIRNLKWAIQNLFRSRLPLG